MTLLSAAFLLDPDEFGALLLRRRASTTRAQLAFLAELLDPPQQSPLDVVRSMRATTHDPEMRRVLEGLEAFAQQHLDGSRPFEPPEMRKENERRSAIARVIRDELAGGTSRRRRSRRA